jgi:hypothetical protein
VKIIKLLLFFTLLTVVASAQTIKFDNKYEAPAFTATFPTGADIKYARTEEGGAVTNSYTVSMQNGNVYIWLSYHDDPTEARHKTLDQMVDDHLAPIKDAKVTKGEETIGNLRGRAGVATGTIQGLEASGYTRVAISGKRLWQIIIFRIGGGVFTEVDANRFFNSVVIR